MALTDKLSAVGDAIREKTGKSGLLTLDQMVTEISGIETGGGSNDYTFLDCVTIPSEHAAILLNVVNANLKIECGLKIPMEDRFIWVNGWSETSEKEQPFLDSVGSSLGWTNVVISKDANNVAHVTAELNAVYSTKLRIGFWDNIFSRAFPLYYFKVLNTSGDLLCDVRPAVDKNGIVGFYDAVTQHFHDSNYRFPFIAGEVV